MTWCPWIFSSTWLFRESGPDANSRSLEAPGCWRFLDCLAGFRFWQVWCVFFFLETSHLEFCFDNATWRCYPWLTCLCFWLSHDMEMDTCTGLRVCRKLLERLLRPQRSHHLVRGQVVHVLDRESRTDMKEPLYNTSRCLMTWCPWIFSSTWLFRESGPDANSRSPEAPGCFGDFWTVSLDFDWVWFFCSWGFKFSILLLQQSVRMFVMLLLALPLDSVLGTHRWIDWFFD